MAKALLPPIQSGDHSVTDEVLGLIDAVMALAEASIAFGLPVNEVTRRWAAHANSHLEAGRPRAATTLQILATRITAREQALRLLNDWEED
jgi:hypothetical protein